MHFRFFFFPSNTCASVCSKRMHYYYCVYVCVCVCVGWCCLCLCAVNWNYISCQDLHKLNITFLSFSTNYLCLHYCECMNRPCQHGCEIIGEINSNTLFTLYFQTVLAQFVTCLCSFSYKCKHYQNSAEATVMGLPCFCVPGWFRNSLGNEFTTVLARFVHVV